MPIQQLPLFAPSTGWVQKSLPFHLLSGSQSISLDTETFDPYLLTKGPGFWRKAYDRFLCGISIADAHSEWYFPLRHFAYNGSNNLPADEVHQFMNELLSNPLREVFLANGSYDIGWLRKEGIAFKARPFDVQIAESLLDEENPDGNTLDQLGLRYQVGRKEETTLDEGALAFLEKKEKAKSCMHKLPPNLVGAYAEQDARVTYDVAMKQKPLLTAEGLERVMALEMSLTPHLLDMTFRGVRIDIGLAERANRQWRQEVQGLLRSVNMTLEDVRSSARVAKRLIQRGFRPPQTQKGNHSIKNEYLLSLRDPEFAIVARARELNHLREEFIEKKLLSFTEDGRLHPHYVQLARDDEEDNSSGTRSGRLSSRNPNEQQIPKRSSICVDPYTLQLVEQGGVHIGKVIRATRLPEEGCQWAKFDYSAQEPRWQCHYGLMQKLPGAEEAKAAFQSGLKIYTFMSDATGLDYDMSKMCSLARAYGQTANGFSRKTGIPKAQAEEILQAFDAKLPYIAVLAKQASALAQRRGYVKTVLGRRRHFRYFISRNHWDYVNEAQDIRKLPPSHRTKEQKDRLEELATMTTPVFGEAKARSLFPEGYIRDATHKAFNSVIQGSSGDQTKTAFVMQCEAGYAPLSTVHDEINHSIQSEKDIKVLQEIQETCIPSLCPFDAAPDVGDHWQ